MAYTYTRVHIAGNLTRDIELKYTASGMAIASMSVGTNERRKVNEEWVDEPCFTDCTAFGKTAEIAGEYLSKGSFVVLEGRLKFDQWEKDGQKRSKLGVVIDKLIMPNSKKEGGQETQQRPQQQSRGSSYQGNAKPRQTYQTEDIPF